jgi:glycosyltransferase involved in cell wall biosynthesis
MGAVASVIVPVNNAKQTLGDQLSALADQTDGLDFEVVVVLNRCSDDSRAVAQSFSARLPLLLVEADEQPSAAYARNIGVAKSSAPILLFCDADYRVFPQWIAEMVKALQPGGPDFVGGRIVVDRSRLPGWIYRTVYQWCDGSCIFGEFLLWPMSASLAVGARRSRQWAASTIASPVQVAKSSISLPGFFVPATESEKPLVRFCPTVRAGHCARY